jgi:gamma-glutamylcyclotransferase (GGCT)/AIG2-like uncharacterized protein YtfP
MKPDDAKALLSKFGEKSSTEKWRIPFPMGVFGTLRKGCGNDPLMYRNGSPCDHKIAFLPHFYASGLSVTCEENACAPFEVYFYEPKEWEKMIDRVDMLEGCYQMETKSKNKSDWGYFRTLVWLYLFPEDYSSPLFKNCVKTDAPEDHTENTSYRGASGRRGVDLWGKRDLELGKESWKTYDRIPCWVYSSVGQNKKAKKLEPNPIIWDSVD